MGCSGFREMGMRVLGRILFACVLSVLAAGGARADYAGITSFLEDGAALLHRVGDSRAVPRTHGPISAEIVVYPSNERPGTIIISNEERTLHRILPGGRAERFKISVGRDGFLWTGTTLVGRKAKWPAWRPPAAGKRQGKAP